MTDRKNRCVQECGEMMGKEHNHILNQGKVRQVHNDIWIPVLQELIESGKQVRMTVSGSSMSPLICHQRDSVLLEPIRRELKKGDIVFYQRTNGQYVLHRICKIDRDGHIYCIGDAQKDMEGPLDKKQFFAVVTAINRKGQWIVPGDFWWEFFEHIWLRMIPARRWMIHIYGKMQAGSK